MSNLLLQFVQESPFLTYDLLESCFPYALLRDAYNSVYRKPAVSIYNSIQCSVLPSIYMCARRVGPTSLQYIIIIYFPVMWEWGEFKTFDVATGPPQIML